ncbi:hypothetical protein K491DRAFT_713158 [Lophiostoma macrostomum CBS 122681]|uniref:Uncharacterized protein n=1 Tax=Lophiostoma macrostomum CBS 122681 TaxID=1314788 RepID=A0A6A6THT8_9PLEO|nr:hypothetical protein K491DRAFT_713158 [Lophiostoma macrostomum CBS 122681]
MRLRATKTDLTCSRQDWIYDAASHQRGTAWPQKLYADDLKPTDQTFHSHRDFGWNSREINYGLYFSDDSILNGVESELVVLGEVMAQDLAKMVGWHLRAKMRVELSVEGCEKVQWGVELFWTLLVSTGSAGSDAVQDNEQEV